MQPNLETSLSLTSSEHFVLQYYLVSNQGKAQQVKTTPGNYDPNFRDNTLINILKSNVEEGRKYWVQYFLVLSHHHSVVLHRNEISYSLLAAEQGVGLDGIYSMREYTHIGELHPAPWKVASLPSATYSQP